MEHWLLKARWEWAVVLQREIIFNGPETVLVDYVNMAALDHLFGASRFIDLDKSGTFPMIDGRPDWPQIIIEIEEGRLK